MSRSAEQILQEALLLADAERGALAVKLIESLDPGTDDDDPTAWDGEIRQRLAELDSGSVRAVPWEEARRSIVEDADDVPPP